MEKKTLILPLKKRYYDMIKSGYKTEEYRAKKPYYATRFKDEKTFAERYDAVEFTLGYPPAGDTERRMRFPNPRMRIGEGQERWGAEPGVEYYCITWDK